MALTFCSSDLRHITQTQRAKIDHLESFMTSMGFNTIPPAPFLWSGSTGDRPYQPDLQMQLEVMRPSPEPPVWNPSMIAYEPSPSTGLSSISVSGHHLRRSSSLSLESVEEQNSSPMDDTSPDSEEKRGRQMDRAPRKDSALDIQVSMGGMDLDVMFGGVRREEEAGGMRW